MMTITQIKNLKTVEVNDMDVGIYVRCRFCGDEHICVVPKIQWENFKKNPNQNIQTAMPNMDMADREMFISGMCPDCWEKCFCQPEPED